MPHRVRPKVFSQNTGLKPMGPTYFGQNENLWFDMSHLGDGSITLKINLKNKNLEVLHGLKYNDVFFFKMKTLKPNIAQQHMAQKKQKLIPWGLRYLRS